MAVRERLKALHQINGRARIGVGPEHVPGQIGREELGVVLGQNGVPHLDAGLRILAAHDLRLHGGGLRRIAGGEGVVGILKSCAVVEDDIGAHVIATVAEHSSDLQADLAAVAGGRGLGPGAEPVAGGGSELDRDLAGCRQVDGVLRDLGIAGFNHDAGLNDGDDRSGVVLRGRAGECSRDGYVFALLDKGRRGVVAGGIDGAHLGVAAGDAVH